MAAGDSLTTSDLNTSDGGGTHYVQQVGNVVFALTHPYLTALDATKYSAGVNLTGFKLEDTLVSSDQQIDNAKLVPLLNGDTITLTNLCKAGTLTFACVRTSAGIAGGDITAIADFIRTQGDGYGGTLTVTWVMAGNTQTITFKSVTVKRCPPLQLAGNDVPSWGVQLAYGTYSDGAYPTITANAGGGSGEGRG